MRLGGRGALVTGAGRGIGAETARALAEEGAKVALVARNMAQVVEVAGQLRDRGHEAIAIRCDVARRSEVKSAVLSAVEALGRVDILVNNAGTATSNPLHKVTLREWRHLMDVNATGTFLCTQAVMPGMLEQGWGRVVNVASVAGVEGAKYVSAYTAAKHAVVGFTRAVAAEVADTGVTVNAVCPGYVDTPLTDETIARVMAKTGMDRDAALAAILKQSGQPRLIRGAEVAEAIVSLCRPGASHWNGETVVMDGKELRA